MSIILPAGWCDDGSDSQRHRYMRCLQVKVINGVPCQCIKRVRAQTTDVPHSHQYELPSHPLPCKSLALLSYHQKMLKESVAKMVACMNLSAVQVENKALKEVVLIAIKAGQDIRDKSPEQIYPDINRQNIIPLINIAAEDYQKARLSQFQNGFSSLSLDAGTLINRHFLDFVISPPAINVKPLLFDSLEMSRLGVQEYGSTVLDVVTDLFKNGVRIGSIIADNHPVQKAAIAHFSPSSILKTSNCEAIKAIRFFSCGAHTTALMLERAVNNCPTLARFDSFLKGTISAINDTPLKRIVGHCPTIVSTRWLSRIRALDWILRREDQLKDGIEHQFIQDANRAIQSNVKQGLSFERLEILRVFAHTIYPFHCAIKYLEGDSITQAAIFPVTTSMLDFYQSVKELPMFSAYPGMIESIIEGITHYMKECYDWPLLSLCYLCTLEGRAWFISDVDEQEFSSKWKNFKKISLDFEYSVNTDPSVNQYHENINADVTDEEAREVESDIIDEFMTNAERSILPDNEIVEEEIADVIHPPQEKINVYDSALDAAIHIVEDMGLNTDVIPTQFATWMFDPGLDEFLWKSRGVPISSIWSALSGDDRIKELRRGISRIITARATEACVEREFSREKLILGRLRSRMGGKLLKSRSLLMESSK